nr:hypothetical protein BaRGS_003751 [Batillaria attramentaria]
MQGPSDNANIVGNDVQLLCQVYEDEKDIHKPPAVPFNVTWFFKPEDVDSSMVVLTWLSDGRGVPYSISSNSTKYEASSSLAGLVIKSVTLDDAGLYTCHLDAVGQPSDGYGAHLMVLDHPDCFNENPETFFEQNITLDCSIPYRGYRPPSVDWRLGTLKLNSTTAVKENKSMLVETLTLMANDHMNGYVYHCHAEYPGLTQIECMAHPQLTVYKKVKVVSLIVTPVIGHDHTLIPSGTQVSLQCSAQGFPFPLYSWYFRSLANPGTLLKIESKDSHIIRSFEILDEGTYTCYAVNEIKSEMYHDSKNITLRIKGEEVEYGNGQPYAVGRAGQSQNWNSNPKGGEAQAQQIGSTNQLSPYAIGAVISAALAVLLIIIFIVLASRMKKRDRKMREKLARAHDETLDDQEVELLDETVQPNGTYLPSEYSRLKMSWEIPRKDVRLLEQIGRGSFVEVWKGRMRRTPGTNDIMRIIVKKLDSEATEQERHFFTTELEVMKMLPAHPNIVRLVGSYTTSEPWLLMLEVAAEGTLLEFLQRHRPGQQEIVIGRGNDQPVFMRKQTLTAQKLLCLAAQVASGLEHLQKFKLIYYRLQCARVLVAKGGVCKLSGFGFPQEITDRNTYQQASAPVRWMAPESLVDNVYNVKTDIWAYGVLVWEILHFGVSLIS